MCVVSPVRGSKSAPLHDLYLPLEIELRLIGLKGLLLIAVVLPVRVIWGSLILTLYRSNNSLTAALFIFSIVLNRVTLTIAVTLMI